MRYAIYYSPSRNDPLTALAARWLGRDAFSGAPCEHLVIGGMTRAEIAALASMPRRYGFHATLRAPFRLAAGVSETRLAAWLDDIAPVLEPVFVPGLKVRQIGDFFALMPTAAVPELDRLAAVLVRQVHRLAAPPAPRELARRRAVGLSARQDALLNAWGYPYVLEEFRFHMTLTGPVKARDQARVRAALDTLFAPLARPPVLVDRLQLFCEREEDGGFIVCAEARLGQAKSIAKGAA